MLTKCDFVCYNMKKEARGWFQCTKDELNRVTWNADGTKIQSIAWRFYE